MNILVTGGAGFIGSHFVRHMLSSKDNEVINYDSLTYAGNLENLRDIENLPNYHFVKGDITDGKLITETLKKHAIDVVFNFAAESHVDRSILDVSDFINTNISGTQKLIDASRTHKVKRYIQVSTDEVYGSLSPDENPFTESNNLKPNSPYAASKTAGDLLCRAAYKTHGFPVIITRCSNNYGPNQFPEKFIPVIIKHALENTKIPVYGTGMNIRDWIHVTDHCRALECVMQNGQVGEVYNIGGNCERHNLDIVKTVLKILGVPENLISFVKDRPGHDIRYAIDSSKMAKQLKWKSEIPFDKGIAETVAWYRENSDWVEGCIAGDYLKYYERNYAHKYGDMSGR